MIKGKEYEEKLEQVRSGKSGGLANGLGMD